MAPYKTKETKSLIASKKWCFRSLLSDFKNLFPCSAQNQKGHTWNEGGVYRICSQNEFLKKLQQEKKIEITEFVFTDQ